MGKKIYPLHCECCNPQKVLQNYAAKQYHLRKMAKKRSASSISAQSNDAEAAPAPAVNKASVTYIFYP